MREAKRKMLSRRGYDQMQIDLVGRYIDSFKSRTNLSVNEALALANNYQTDVGLALENYDAAAEREGKKRALNFLLNHSPHVFSGESL
ncbi:hypothetical protein HYV50_05150 [Candidatus Pacearchaeota archaeon]|nr:hypothetical protein [Candidatus Pacearchaeota archaeon]